MVCLYPMESMVANSSLWSLDSLFLCFATAVVRWSFAMIGFFDFMSWLGHCSFLDGSLYLM